jgi:chemotaxis signal transduction protein
MPHTHIARHMSSVEAYRQRLASLQGAWDTLSLLSHLATDSSDMTGTRQAFEALSADLIKSLASETHKKSLLALKARAQIAIDILVRNLFERTADIGFLSADQDICEYVREASVRKGNNENEANATRKEALHARLRAYVAKYSVYNDIALLAADGTLLLKLDRENSIERSSDPLIAQTLNARASYVETYRHVDIFANQKRSLIYSHRVGDGSQTSAVLCLCFNLEDEVTRIFSKLSSTEDWSLYAFVDESGHVIASSDPWQLPQGARVPLAMGESGNIVRFAGREYLAITRSTPGYQGYAGPGWLGHVMIPLEHAFDTSQDQSAAGLDERVLQDLCESEALFSTELRRIPHQARRIQEDLNRSVWNGNVRLSVRNDNGNTFAKALLREIGNAGRRTQETFERSIADLQRTVTSAISHSASVLATLAVDILDRNLYERANDCRWWALNAALVQHLSGAARDAGRVSSVLRHINALYTVYHGIVLFDAQGVIHAASHPGHEHLIGKRCEEEWVGATLALRHPQDFAVSGFCPSELYDGQPTLIFGAALGISTGRAIGGIGIVFDSKPQLAAMLADSLPRASSGAIAEGCIALFVDASHRVIAASSGFEIGESADLPAELFDAHDQGTTRIVEYQGSYYAAATCITSGYREYAGMEATAIVMIALGPRPQRQPINTKALAGHGKRANAGEPLVEIATFFCGGQWLGVLRDHVIEALDASSLRRLPSKPAWHAGVLMYQDKPVPVIDLAQLIGTAPSNRREIVIVQAAKDRMRIGLLIEELASIPEVPATNLLPLSDCAMRSASRIVDRAVRPESAEDPVLLIINIDQVLIATRGACDSTSVVS